MHVMAGSVTGYLFMIGSALARRFCRNLVAGTGGQSRSTPRSLE
ncbi:MAG: hypothetical protein ACREUR_00085 [Nitrosospira sp.]